MIAAQAHSETPSLAVRTNRGRWNVLIVIPEDEEDRANEFMEAAEAMLKDLYPDVAPRFVWMISTRKPADTDEESFIILPGVCD